ncbi:hypothetical protein [Kribbella lupini]|uniref:Polysaccharide deacetylase n=1 Tax=Kribbella lupini TaxID=291602 RepID=A0ABP4M3S2_9ACTN
MHHANHFYGHAHIMAKYAGLPAGDPPTIWGYLQHGWNILDGFAYNTAFVAGMPKFVWSDTVRRRGWSMGLRNYSVIGSAWLYLLELHPELAAPAPDAAGTIFYPFHGWEGQNVLGDHAEIVASINEHETGPVTVCLYWNEFENEAIKQVYTDAGFRVITHGYRGLHWRKTDADFLLKQLKELRKHRRVASNRLSSAVLYGASIGLQPGVYGDPMLLENEHPSFGGQARIRRLWPELNQPYVPLDLAKAFTDAELGVEHLAGPAEIRDLFRWTDPALLVKPRTAKVLS